MIYFSAFYLDNVESYRRFGFPFVRKVKLCRFYIPLPPFKVHGFRTRTEVFRRSGLHFDKHRVFVIFCHYIHFSERVFLLAFQNFVPFLFKIFRRGLFAYFPQKFFIKVLLCNLQGPISFIFSICALVPYPLCFSNPYSGNSFAYSSISLSLYTLATIDAHPTV